MKKILILFITFYQKIISPLLHQLLGVKSGCRSCPTCSAYAKEAIIHYGVIKGSLLATRRLANCQPLFSI